MHFLRLAACAFAAAALPVSSRAQDAATRAEWNVPHAPVHLFGNAYYVGTNGLGAVLLTSPEGHVLIDGALPESAPLIIANVRSLGFRIEDVRVILNTHAHFDHAGGIAALQKASGAEVAASPASARELLRGGNEPDDPQFGLPSDYPRVPAVRVLHDGEIIHVGSIAATAHFTPGHTPGGTTWTFHACEGDRCLSFVYADSQTPVSNDNFLFTNNAAYPGVLADFAHSHDVLERLPCDVLITPHPGASQFWERVRLREAGDANGLVRPNACVTFARNARDALAQRVAAEKR